MFFKFHGYVHEPFTVEGNIGIVKCIDASQLSDLRDSFTGFVRCVILSLTDESVENHSTQVLLHSTFESELIIILFCLANFAGKGFTSHVLKPGFLAPQSYLAKIQ